ncbi:oxidoreductase [Kaistia sp. 32K]|uniref:DUF934 domain-containing protein n=1 Tax=Kaistia sp. 32K TaxID=2795690 RepID=UPI001915D9C9|nr:DUF934 domain-containing protein [Kaistia sp. 32K]BCP51820.1 oxidoreductase [Kaistia sp. 32K]
MSLWKNGSFVEDAFRRLADDELPADGEAVIVSLERFRAEREALLARSAPLGVVIEPGADWSDIVADLPRLAVVAADLPKFADGRAFSIGRLLRDRDGFRGELRAVGAFFLDQIPFLKRVGFDAFSTEDPLVLKGLREGRWPEVTEYLQPIAEQGEVPAGTRPWARRPTARVAD